jgi:hypothetical protein
VRYRRRNFPAPLFWFLFLAHRFPEAIQEARIAVSLKPDGPGGLWFLGYALIANGQPEEAIAPMEKALAKSNRSPGVLAVRLELAGVFRVGQEKCLEPDWKVFSSGHVLRSRRAISMNFFKGVIRQSLHSMRVAWTVPTIAPAHY